MLAYTISNSKCVLLTNTFDFREGNIYFTHVKWILCEITCHVGSILPDLTISLDIMPPFHQKWGYNHNLKYNMDPVGVVWSALAGFLMGLDERPPHEPFPVLLEQFV